MTSATRAVACALSVVVASVLAGPAAPRRASAGTPAHAVGVRLLELADAGRDTPADPDAQRGPIPASEGRALPTTVFYPAVGEGPTDPTASS